MGFPMKEQLENPHPKATPNCEGCWGSGWLTALVDSPDWLREAGIDKPADFCMSCSECAVMTDLEAMRAASKAGLRIEDSGLVRYTDEQLSYLKDQQPATSIFTLVTPEGKEIVLGAFDKESKACSFAKRKHAADWLQLCSFPIQQRLVKPGEVVKHGDLWKED